MTGAVFRHHGGRLSDARAAWPDAPQPWLDLSTGINPQPWRGKTPHDPRRLPDPADLAALQATAARAFGVDPSRVAATAGAEAALRLLPRLLNAKTVAIVSPTYGAHADAWAQAGVTVQAIEPDALSDVETDAAVVVNPNNPDGRILPASAMGARSRGWLIVDESFADATPKSSIEHRIDDRLIVLRSFGKFYGLAGVRLGFIIAPPEFAAKVRAAQGDWPISAQAIAYGRAAYADTAWADRTRARLRRDAARLDKLLTRRGFAVTGDCPLFRLAHTPNAQRWFEALCAQGVLVRPFDHTPDALRFGLPSAKGWGKLEAALDAARV
jgi:cobalamin biosynthetic protein CobC